LGPLGDWGLAGCGHLNGRTNWGQERVKKLTENLIAKSGRVRTLQGEER